MRILFAGTPGLSAASLEEVAGSFNVCAVLTAPDRPSGRGRKLKAPPVKLCAQGLGIPVLQPEKIDESFRKAVYAFKSDVLVVAAYSKIFRGNFLALFPMGGMNLHPSILPKHRGPSPLQAAILSGDAETGVTIQKLALEMDAGDILAQEKIPLRGDETTPELERVAARIGARLLVDTLRRYESGDFSGIPQKEDEATYCPLVKKEDGLIIWELGAGIICSMMRAYLPWPRAYTIFKGRELYLLKGGIFPRGNEYGDMYSRDAQKPESGSVVGIDKMYGILVHTGRDILYIEELQLQSKKSMHWKAFLNGQKEFIGTRLGG